MAGPMNTLCSAIREELTELLLLGKPLPAPLTRHVATCEECAEEAEGVRRVVRTFERADSPGLPLPGLRDPQTPADEPGAAPARRRVRFRRRAAAVTSLVLAACAAFVTVVTTTDDRTGTPVAAVHVSQEGRMVSRSWGTEVPVSLSGLTPGKTYRLMTGDAHGDRVQAGSVHAGRPDAPMHVRMITAMARDSITTLYVQDANGHFVAQARAVPQDNA